MTKHRTAGRIGRLGRRKTLRGSGAFVTSLRKKILAAPHDYKEITVKYLQASRILRAEGKHPNEEVFKQARSAATEKAGFAAVKAAWDKVVAAQKALSIEELTKIKNVNAEIPAELKTDPVKKAAYLSGATRTALKTLGVILTPIAAVALFTAAAACFVTTTVLMVPIATFDMLIAMVVGVFGGTYDVPLANLNYLAMGACVGADLSRGGQRARRGGGPDEAIKAAEKLAEKGAGAEAADLQEAIGHAADALVPLQKAYNAALLEGISALQGRYGDAHSDKMGEVMTLPDFAPIKDTKEDISTRMAIAAAAAARAKEPLGDDPGEKPADNEAFATAQIKDISSRLGMANAKAPPPRGAPKAAPAAASAAAEPEAAEPEAAAPEPAADDPNCWTHMGPDDEGDEWYEQKSTSKSEWVLPPGATECGGTTGARRRRTRGGDKPLGPKPPELGGRRRKTRKSTRGRRR
jgi:hypothetical protein